MAGRVAVPAARADARAAQHAFDQAQLLAAPQQARRVFSLPAQHHVAHGRLCTFLPMRMRHHGSQQGDVAVAWRHCRWPGYGRAGAGLTPGRRFAWRSYACGRGLGPGCRWRHGDIDDGGSRRQLRRRRVGRCGGCRRGGGARHGDGAGIDGWRRGGCLNERCHDERCCAHGRSCNGDGESWQGGAPARRCRGSGRHGAMFELGQDAVAISQAGVHIGLAQQLGAARLAIAVFQ